MSVERRQGLFGTYACKRAIRSRSATTPIETRFRKAELDCNGGAAARSNVNYGAQAKVDRQVSVLTNGSGAWMGSAE